MKKFGKVERVEPDLITGIVNLTGADSELGSFVFGTLIVRAVECTTGYSELGKGFAEFENQYLILFAFCQKH